MTKSTRLGIMSGFLAMLLVTMLYVMNPTLLVLGYERFSLLIFFLAILYAVIEERKTTLTTRNIKDLLKHEGNGQLEVNDFASFSELLRLGFKIYVIGFFIKYFFVYFLFNYYDPQLIEMVKEVTVEKFIGYRNPEDTELIFQQKLIEFKAGNFAPTLTNVLGIGIELIVGFIMAFFVAIFFKREEPGY